MAVELVQVRCPACGEHAACDPGLSNWHCEGCGKGFFLRRCATCARISHVAAPHGYHKPWACTWCASFNEGFSQNRDPASATAAELAAETAGEPEHRNPALEPERPDGGAANATSIIPGLAYPAPPPPAPGTAVPGLAAPGSPGHAQEAGGPDTPRAPGPRPRRVVLAIGAIVACAVVVAVALTAAGGNRAATTNPGRAGQAGQVPRTAPGQPGASASASAGGQPTPGGQATGPGAQATGPGVHVVNGAGGALSVTAARVSAIYFQGVPGQLTVTGAASGSVTLTGQLHSSGAAPAVHAVSDDGVLVVSLACPPGSTCDENLRLTVPEGARTALRQAGGSISVAGLAGPLQITADGTDVTASGLRSPSLTTTIANGQLNGAFAAPPAQVNVTLTSAQGTIRLPAGAAYRVTRDVISGSLNVTVPQSQTASRTVTASVRAGELNLLSR